MWEKGKRRKRKMGKNGEKRKIGNSGKQKLKGKCGKREEEKTEHGQ